MGWCSGFAVVLSVVVSPPAESGPIDLQPAGPESVKMPASIVMAQFDIGTIFGGGSGRKGPGHGSEDNGKHSGGHKGGHKGGHGPSITFPPFNPGHSHGEGSHGPIISIPMPMPNRPTHEHPPYYPRPDYTPTPNYTPSPTITPVSPNVLPTRPETPAEPEANVVLVDPEPNNFLDKLGIKPITPQQLGAFQKQLTKKNSQLANDLKKLFPGNDQAIDQLVASANGGKLNVQAVQQFISAMGGNLSLQLQLQATGLFKQLVFNNLAMAALLNVNVNLLNINVVNINIVNINVIGGGVMGGFWGFPMWPWDYPVWLGPGVWWGPCAYCPFPYYNPHLHGADALGIPYSLAPPVPDYQGEIVTRGILLTNTGGSAVNYIIDGRRYAMEPNFRQTIARGRIVIVFNRGGSFGNPRYGIDEGWYTFTATDRGWELYKRTAKITLDNTDNPFQFNYVLNNRRQTLQPGYRQQHTGRYPLELRFADGKGQTVRKMLTKGDFKVAVGGSGGLELFRPEDVAMPAPMAEMSKKAEERTPNIFAQPETIPNLFGDTTASAAPARPSGSVAPAGPSLFGPES